MNLDENRWKWMKISAALHDINISDAVISGQTDGDKLNCGSKLYLSSFPFSEISVHMVHIMDTILQRRGHMKIAFSVNSSMIKRSIYTLVVPFFLVCKRWMREQTRSGLLTFVPLGIFFGQLCSAAFWTKQK